MGRIGTVCILAAGQGTRMRSSGPKVLHPLCGRSMLGWVLEQARALEPERIVVVVGHGADEVRAHVEQHEPDPRIRFVLQTERLGTGHAVRCALDELREGPDGPVVVLYGDMPLLTSESLEALLARKAGARAAAVTAVPAHPRGFGRVVRDAAGAFQGVVEEKDASPDQLAIREVNVGVYAFERDDLLEFLPALSNDNAQGEYYLTDVPAMVLERGGEVATLTLTDEREAIGINTLSHLAEARAEIQARILERHLEAGVRIVDPATTYVDHGVTIGAGTRIQPCVVVHAGVEIGADCEIGPFAQLRPGARLQDRSKLGNFCEMKNATLGEGSKASHLSYMGDVTIGPKANIGAGTIVANYDGKQKHPTEIGAGAFVGSGSVLIAPCKIGDRALTGGGAVVTRNTEIPEGEAWVGVPARPLRKRAED